LALVCLPILFLLGCGEEQPVTIDVPAIDVTVPKKVAVEQPIEIIDPLKVEVINTNAVSVNITTVVLYRGSKVGFYYLFLEGNISNTTGKPVMIEPDRIDIKVNRKSVGVDMTAIPDIVQPDTSMTFWFYTADFLMEEQLTYAVDFNLDK